MKYVFAVLIPALACISVAGACSSPIDLGNHEANGADASPDSLANEGSPTDGGATPDADAGVAGGICSKPLGLIGSRVDLTPLLGDATQDFQIAAARGKVLIAWGGDGSFTYGFAGSTDSREVQLDHQNVHVAQVVARGTDFYVAWWSSPDLLTLPGQMGVTRIAANGTAGETRVLAVSEPGAPDPIAEPATLTVSDNGMIATFFRHNHAYYTFGPSGDAGDGNATAFVDALPPEAGVAGWDWPGSNAVWTGSDFAFLWYRSGDVLARLAPNATQGATGPVFPLRSPEIGPVILGRLGDGFVVLSTPLAIPDGGNPTDPQWRWGTQPIRATRLDATGAAVGSEVDLGTFERQCNVIDCVLHAGEFTGMSALWTGSAFLLVTADAKWNPDAGAASPFPHKVRLVDASGLELSPSFAFDTDIRASDPQIAWTGTDFAIVWYDWDGAGELAPHLRKWMIRVGCN